MMNFRIYQLRILSRLNHTQQILTHEITVIIKYDTITIGTKVNFVNNLGKRIKKVTIANEGDSIKVTPTGWIDKKVWREINDLLRLHQFSWLSNGKDSCWMKLLS